jgi:hypothetical protein
MTHRQNKLATFNIVKTLHLTLWSREPYLLNILFPAVILTCLVYIMLNVLFCILPLLSGELT